MENECAATTPAALAHRLAHIAHALRQAIQATLHNAEQRNEIPFPCPAECADMYAQTIVYGLFAERIAGQAGCPTLSQLVRLYGEEYLSGSSSETKAIRSLIEECATFLAQTDISPLLNHNGTPACCDDPLTHFYETFLAAYDPAQRGMRGVYYTPAAVVSYIVSSVDALLRTHFGMPLGLADARVALLDPAMGTATFLHTVVQHIAHTTQQHGMAWDEYVSHNLLPRMAGFEVMLAPYTIARLKMERILQQHGYTPRGNESFGMEVRNVLADDMPGRVAETTAEQVAVVLGNPPYANYGMLNQGTWIEGMLHDYKRGLNERKLNLNDDCIKFMRFGQWWVERHPAGIMAFITNNTYIDGITHRRMRQSLLETFTHIYILDLHGNARKREHAPGGGRDENVFDIQQGVAIGLFVRVPGSHGPTAIYHADMWGTRQEKYDHLATSNVTTTAWKPLRSRPEWFMFVPRNIDSTDEYATFWKLSDIFTVQQNSIKTDRDSLFVDMERETLEQRIQTFYSAEGLRSPFRETYRVENSSSYDILSRRLNTSFNPNYIRRCLYRPFDIRWMYYAPGITSRPAWRVMRHLLAGENIALVGMRQYEYRVQSYCYVYVTEHITESRVFISNRGAASVFPLYVYSEEGERESGEDAATGCNRTHNFAPAFVAAVEQYLGLSCTAAGSGNLEHTVGPEDLFHYLYAVLHIPTYRRQYADSLKVDFPRIPLPRDRATFAALVAHGALLLDLHLLRVPGQGGVGGCGGSAVLAHPTGQGIMLACQGERMTVGTPRYHAPHNSQPGHIAITPHQHIEGVDAETWTMQLGGYYPLEKWLKDRRGRILTDDELRHYLRMVLALRETRRIMRDLDNYWTAIAR